MEGVISEVNEGKIRKPNLMKAIYGLIFIGNVDQIIFIGFGIW